MASKAELRRLGGLAGVLAMLENPKPSVQESAVLVLTNCTQGDDAFSLQLMQTDPDKLRLLLSFLQSPNELIQSNIARALSNATSVDPDSCKDFSISDALMFCGVMPNILKLMSSGRVPLLRSLSVTLDNILQDLPEASGTMMEMGGPGPVFDAIACGDAIVLEHCCSILARMAECSPLFAPFICQDGGAHMRTVVRVLGASLLTDTKPLDSLIDIEPADESLLTTLATVTSASALAVATFYEIQGIVALGKLLLAPNAGLQLHALRIFANCVSVNIVTSVAAAADDTITHLRKQLAGIREFFLHSEALLTMTWMLDHASRKVQAEARRFMEGLRTFGGSIAPPLGEPLLTTSGADTLAIEAFVIGVAEGGVVPVLQGLTGSSNDATVEFSAKLLHWIKDNARGTCLNKLFTSVASNEDTNARLRACVALFYMSFDAKWIRDPFLNKSGLPVILQLLKMPGPTRFIALEFLKAIEPILQPMEDDDEEEIVQTRWSAAEPLLKYKNLADPPEFEDFAMDDVNVREDSDLILRVGPNPDDMHTIHLHKNIMAAHSAVVAGMLSTQREIEIPGVHPGFVERVMKGIYGGDMAYIWDEPKAAVDKMAREMIDAAAAEKAQTLQKAASKARLGTSKAAAPPKPPAPPQVPQWDDVAYSIKVLLFANRMQILRLQRMASMRLVDQLCPDNLLRIFKGGLAAADIALCAACMGLLIQELPVGQARAELPPPSVSEKSAKKGAAASTTPKASAKSTTTPERKAAGARADSPARRAGSAERASGGGSEAPAEAPDAIKSAAGTSALEKDIKDIIEVLKSFICRVMSSSSADDK